MMRKLITHSRTEKIVNPADPTQLVRHTFTLGPVKVVLTEFFGDITSETTLRYTRTCKPAKLFTSPVIHPLVNKLFTRLFDRCERKYQDEQERYEQMRDAARYW